MVEQINLIHPSAFTLKPSAETGQPYVWIKRLVILERQGKILRDVQLRRGLNIIWSADEQDNASSNSQLSGHGVGKTLFCRLLRYCLGEKTFANKDLRRQIRTVLPHAHVGAEVILNGKSWAVIRPIGTGRKEIATLDFTLDELLQADDYPDVGVEALTDAISETLFAELFTQDILRTKNSNAWMTALAWMARDQECRLQHPLEWRSASSDTRPAFSNISKTTLLSAVRILLGAADEELVRLQDQKANINAKSDETKHERESRSQEVRFIEKNLRRKLQLDESLHNTTPIALNKMRVSTSERFNTASDTTESDTMAKRLKELDDHLEAKFREETAVEIKIQQAENHLQQRKEQLGQLLGEKGELSIEQAKELWEDYCPICNVEIEIPLNNGCPLEKTNLEEHPITKEQRQERLAAQISRAEQDIQRLQSNIDAFESDSRIIRNEIASFRREQIRLRAAKTSADDKQREELFIARSLVGEAAKLSELVGQCEKLGIKLNNLDSDGEELKGKVHAAQAKYNSQLRRLNECFKFVCHEILGTDEDCKIDVTGSNIQIEVGTGGEAMTAFRAVAFDLAALLMTMEGSTWLPAFWIHDSPREADLSSQVYNRYFRFLQKLEASENSPFQYIVTTTTPPPFELQTSPWTVLSLSGNDSQQYLFQKELRIEAKLAGDDDDR